MAAEELLRFALFKEVVRPERRKRRKLNGGTARSDDESGTEDEEELLEEEIAAPTEDDRQRAREKADRLERRERRDRAPSQADPDAEAAAAEAFEDGDVEMAEADLAEAVEDSLGNISAARLDLFRERLSAVFESDAAADGFIEFGDLLPMVNEGLANEDMFGTSEGKAAVRTMHERNELMESDGVVYKV